MQKPDNERIERIKGKLDNEVSEIQAPRKKRAAQKMAEDDKFVTYERGRTGGTVRGPASGMVSGVNGTFKGEGGDAITQRQPKAKLIPPARVRPKAPPMRGPR